MKTLAILCLLLQSAEIFPVTAKSEPVKPDRYLVVFTASWCGPCQQWKAAEKGKLNGVDITTVDIDQDKQWGISTVPTFWVVDRATRQPVKKYTGYTSANTLNTELNSVSVAVKPVGGPQVGRTERERLVNHLLNENIHNGRHTLAELEAMSDEQLETLHTKEHNVGTPAVINPRPVQTVRRRRGLFRW